MTRSRKRIAGVVVAVSLAVILGLAWVFREVSPDPLHRASGSERLPQFLSRKSFEFSRSILWGKLEKGLFSPVNNPRFVSVEQAQDFLQADDRVLVRRAGTSVYVYPEVFLTTHHVVNDTHGKSPVAVTTCTLSGSHAAYSRRVRRRELTFGVTGMLYGGNSVLYDLETESLWLQLNGESIDGPLEGTRLESTGPLELTTWDRLTSTNHGARVLAPVHALDFYRHFHDNIRQEKFGLEVLRSTREPDGRLSPYTPGIGLTVQGECRFYRREAIQQEGARNDRVGGWSILVLYDPRLESCRVYRRFLNDRELTFRLQGDALVDEETGSRWGLDGVCRSGKLKGHQLRAPVYTEVFWFAWAAIYPDTRLG